MRWLIYSPKPLVKDENGVLCYHQSVDADRADVRDGCLVLTNHQEHADGPRYEVVLMLSADAWSSCQPVADKEKKKK